MDDKKGLIKIQTINLKQLIKKTFCPDFIRMDVEGHEEKILKDLTNLKLKKFPIICFETHLTEANRSQKVLTEVNRSLKIFNRTEPN